jgi:hypothetical protein
VLALEKVRIKDGHLEVKVAGTSFVAVPPVRPLLLRQGIVPMSFAGAKTIDAFMDPDDEHSGTVPVDNAVQDARLACVIHRFQLNGTLESLEIPTEAEAWAELKAAR